jgi:hypothetical protein
LIFETGLRTESTVFGGWREGADLELDSWLHLSVELEPELLEKKGLKLGD